MKIFLISIYVFFSKFKEFGRNDGKTSGGDWKIKRGDVKKLKKDLEVSARL